MTTTAITTKVRLQDKPAYHDMHPYTQNTFATQIMFNSKVKIKIYRKRKKSTCAEFNMFFGAHGWMAVPIANMYLA